MLFEYEALTQDGKKKSGIIDAESLQEASFYLHKKDVLVTSIAPYERKLKSVLSKKELLRFTEELAKLLKAGLPLYEALLALEEKYEGQKIHPMLLDISDKVKAGLPLSNALAIYSKSFDFLYCAMVKNAEETGSLEKTLEDLSELYDKQITLKKQFVSALLYPGILACFCVIVLSVLLFFVIPSLADLFEGRNLHPFTKFIFFCSNVANQNKGCLFLCLTLLISGVCFLILAPKGKKTLQNIAIKIPFLSSILMHLALVRFCRAFSALLLGGVSYVEALSLSSKVLSHPPLQKELDIVGKKVLEGSTLSSVLLSSTSIPPLVSRMLAIAEKGGNMPLMLQHVAHIYEDELEKKLYQLTTLLQPIMLLFLGVIVGFVVLSVLLPLTDVSSFINQ